MFIAHKSNILYYFHELEWYCRTFIKGFDKSEYRTWYESILDADGVPDYSGETGYTIIEISDEDVASRIGQLNDYFHPDSGYNNIKVYASKRDAEEILDNDGNSHDPKQYVQSHFVGDDSAKDAVILAKEWKNIRAERDRLLTNSDWTQANDTALASAKVTAWATYRTKLRTLPADQSSETTYADITWPSQPS